MARKRRNKKIVERKQSRKNFLPTLIIIFILWLATACLIYFIDPFTFGAIPAFFALVFTALLFTLSTLLLNTRRGLTIAMLVTLFLLLRYLGVGNIINFLLLIGIGIASEFYFAR